MCLLPKMTAIRGVSRLRSMPGHRNRTESPPLKKKYPKCIEEWCHVPRSALGLLQHIHRDIHLILPLTQSYQFRSPTHSPQNILNFGLATPPQKKLIFNTCLNVYYDTLFLNSTYSYYVILIINTLLVDDSLTFMPFTKIYWNTITSYAQLLKPSPPRKDISTTVIIF